MLDTFKALGDPCRMRLTAVLLAGEFTVQELTHIMGMGQSRISRHLKILTEAAVLAVKRQGTWSYYRVGDGNKFFTAIRSAFERELDALPERSLDLTAVAEVLEERRRRSQEFFDRHARQWDNLARTLLPVPEYRRHLLAQVPECVSVLEIGVGTGGLLTELAARASKVIGVDHSPAMLEEARNRLMDQGVSGVELRLGEMSHLPLSDASVGCVVANMVLHHAADPAAVLAEIRRVLAPAGTLLLADLARHEREAAREQLADQWLGFEEGELTEWLTLAGFAAVDIEHIAAEAGQESVLLVRGKTADSDKPQNSSQQKGA
ncbi:MAG: metalloregulator ArsR/SmtB family transcription factor [Pelobacteraceae bacterium]